MDKMRRAFEAWLLDIHFLQATWNEGRNCYDEYPAHLAFRAWLAAHKAGEWQPIETAPKDGTPVDLWVVHSSFGFVNGRIERRARWVSGTPKPSGWYSFGNMGLDWEHREEEDGSLTTSRPTHWWGIALCGPNGEKDGAYISPPPSPEGLERGQPTH